MDEQDLIARSLAGELQAFNQLVITYQALAYNLAYRLLNDGDAAADAVQDSFIKAFRALDSFRGGSFKSWLMRIVTNTCYDLLRARKRRPVYSYDEMLEEDDEPAQLQMAITASPEEVVENQEVQELLATAIDALPYDQRVVLVLYDVQGYSYDEIAEMTGVSLGTVKSRISRAREKMRSYLVQRMGAGPRVAVSLS